MRGAMTLHIRNVSKTYPNGVQALKDVTLTKSTIERGSPS
jgi:ABC-type phosphate/phosphonate transport system ATPase subunit